MAALVSANRAADLLDLVSDEGLSEALATLDVQSFGILLKEIGLEDAGPLIALASPTQLRALVDESLWSDGPGELEDFEPERFVTWLEVLWLEGEAVLLEGLRAVDEDLLSLGITRRLLILDQAQLVYLMSSEGGAEYADLVDKMMDSSLAHDLDGYLLLSREVDGWQALLEALHLLDRHEPDLLSAILERGSTATMDRVRDEGLVEVLSAFETLEEDARGEREERREELGYVSRSDALALLRLAALRGESFADESLVARLLSRVEPATQPTHSELKARLIALFEERGWLRPRPALADAGQGSSPTRAYLLELAERDPIEHRDESMALLFLANLVTEAGRAAGAEPTASEAMSACLWLCDRGSTDDRESRVLERFGRAMAAAESTKAEHEPGLVSALRGVVAPAAS